jgi:hypothetical protein
VKATTGSGIYDGLLAARLSVRPLPRDVRRTDIAGVRTRPALPLADELALGLWFRKRYSWVSDHRMDGILHCTACAGLKDLIRHEATSTGTATCSSNCGSV